MSGKKQFINFCKDYKIHKALPVTEELLCYYVAYLGDRDLACSTIKCYLAAVRDLHIEYGFPSPFDTSMPRLDRVIRGLKTVRGKQGRAPKRKQPITPKILRQIRSLWSKVHKDYEQTLLWTVAVTCFFGFMRAGELMVSKISEFNPAQHLTLNDVATDSKEAPSFIQLTLKTSKTDPFGRGVNIVIGKTADLLCPVQAMFSYLQRRGGKEGPLFIRLDGTPLTKPYFVKRVREALVSLGYEDSCKFSGHSFRAGAATTAATLKIEDSIIKTLGRWESTAYLLYVRIPREELKGLSKELAKFGKDS